MRPYAEVPAVYLHHNGLFRARPDWYRRFEYPVERERGLDYARRSVHARRAAARSRARDVDAVAIFSLEPPGEALRPADAASRRARASRRAARRLRQRLRAPAAPRRREVRRAPRRASHHRRRLSLVHRLGARHLHRAAGAGAGDRLDGAGARAACWRGRRLVRDGLIPNRFPDGGDARVQRGRRAAVVRARRAPLRRSRRRRASAMARLLPAVRAIIDGYLDGTRLGIGVDDDGLVHAAAPALSLTWMDAKVGDWVRDAARRQAGRDPGAVGGRARGDRAPVRRATIPTTRASSTERAAWARSSFAATFWDEERGWLYDVIDGRRRDATLRPEPALRARADRRRSSTPRAPSACCRCASASW